MCPRPPRCNDSYTFLGILVTEIELDGSGVIKIQVLCKKPALMVDIETTIDDEPTDFEEEAEIVSPAKHGDHNTTRNEGADDEKNSVIAADGWKQLMGNDLLIKVSQC